MNYDLSGLEKKDVKERNHLNIMSVYSIDILFRHFHIFHNYYTENVNKSNSNAIRKGKKLSISCKCIHNIFRTYIL